MMFGTSLQILSPVPQIVEKIKFPKEFPEHQTIAPPPKPKTEILQHLDNMQVRFQTHICSHSNAFAKLAELFTFYTLDFTSFLHNH